MKHYCTFSEAIREGAKIGQQAFGVYKSYDGSTCAIGAGLEAILERELTVDECLTTSGLLSIVRTTEFWDHYAYLRTTADSPCGCAEPSGMTDFNHRVIRSNSLDNIVVHLNNDHYWTRERIADWLEAEEEKLGFVLLSEEEPNCLPVTDREPEMAGVSTLMV
jgi:hypothetical protein